MGVDVDALGSTAGGVDALSRRKGPLPIPGSLRNVEEVGKVTPGLDDIRCLPVSTGVQLGLTVCDRHQYIVTVHFRRGLTV